MVLILVGGFQPLVESSDPNLEYLGIGTGLVDRVHGTGVGVLQVAADEGIFSIGVDSNQNHLHPGSVLTSMMKRVDVAVYEAMSQGEDLETGFQVMGLSNYGVGVALDENNEKIVSYSMLSSVYDAADKIVAGDIAVHDYMSDDSCPALEF